MPILSDISHVWGEDVDVSATGDLALVSGADRTTQRVIRRLITVATTLAQSEYPWQPAYGAGMGERVGLAVNVRELQAIVIGQLNREPSVALTPAPTVRVTEVAIGEFAVDCSYTDQSGIVRSFNFDLGA